MGRRAWLGPLLAALILAASAAMIGLGVWQLNRLQQRRASNAEIRSRLAQAPVVLTSQTVDQLEYQPVQAMGSYDFAQEIVLRNRAYQEQPGVHVLTPLRLDGGDTAVLVDRGWIPYRQAEPAARAEFQRPAGQVTLAGIVRRSQTRSLFILPTDPTPSPDQPRLDAWFWPDLTQIQRQMPYPLLPFYIELAPAAVPAALPISGYEIDLSDGPHLSYALQWFGFTVILLVGSAALWRQRRRQQSVLDTN